MSKARSKSTNILAAKEVPDFEKLYEKFVSTLERSKGARFTTVPVPFSFDGREPAAKKTDEEGQRRRPRSASTAPAAARQRGGKMARPKSSTSLPSELMAETPAMSRSNTTSELREQCNRDRIREREKK